MRSCLASLGIAAAGLGLWHASSVPAAAQSVATAGDAKASDATPAQLNWRIRGSAQPTAKPSVAKPQPVVRASYDESIEPVAADEDRPPALFAARESAIQPIPESRVAQAPPRRLPGDLEPAERRDETPAEREARCRREEEQRRLHILDTVDDRGEVLHGDLGICEEVAGNLKRQLVRDISLDIAPPRPVIDDLCDRPWRDFTGQVIFEGRPYDYNVISEQVSLQATDGRVVTMPLARLSREDQAHFQAMYNVPVECYLPEEQYLARHWVPSTFTWTAAATCHKPRYFEEPRLERYGHSAGPLLQPIISGAHFFATFPILPYKMGLNPPNECIYTLGYYRPGSCAPWILDPIPLSVRAGLWQAGAWVGGVYLVP